MPLSLTSGSKKQCGAVSVDKTLPGPYLPVVKNLYSAQALVVKLHTADIVIPLFI